MVDLTNRDALAERDVPSMIMSNGSSSSMTPMPTAGRERDPAVGAKKRFSVKGNAIVTGGTGMLGLHACDALLEHGLAGVAIFDVDPNNEKAQKGVNELRAKFPQARIETYAVDVTDEKIVGDAVLQAKAALGSIDHLLCYAGIVCSVHSLDVSIDTWRQVLNVNTMGAFVCAQAAARQMVAQGTGGSILFIASISGHRVNFPQPQSAYNVSKAALLALKASLAAEWAHYGIRVNTISPGYMDTILNEGDKLEGHRQLWYDRSPFGRMGAPTELTGAAVLLTSEAGSYMTGTDILVDGGQTIF